MSASLLIAALAGASERVVPTLVTRFDRDTASPAEVHGDAVNNTTIATVQPKPATNGSPRAEQTAPGTA
jgi:hypothetical protein